MTTAASAGPIARGAVRGLGGAALVAAVAVGIIVAHPDDASLVVGSVLLAAGFGVMAPCSVQMSLTMAAVATRRAECEPSHTLRASAGWFTVGYVSFYLLVAIVLGGLARLLGSWAWVPVGLGALAALGLGLATFGHHSVERIGLGRLTHCRGPLGLLRTGRASFQRPFRAGLAFGRYCATCCGPYLLAIAVLAGGGRYLAVGAGIVVAYAVLMALPFLAAAMVSPHAYIDLAKATDRVASRVNRLAGVVLVGLSIALVPAVVAGALG